MKFGLFGGARARGGPAGDSSAYHDFINYVVEAEKLGFSSVFLVEHHFTGFGQVSASMSLLAYLAARTERIRLGTAVVVLPLYDPARLLAEIATVDAMSGGRLSLGVGSGYQPYEFERFGLDLKDSQAMTEELIDKLSRIPGLRVPAPTASFYFRGKPLPVADIARTLGVAYVLDGSVRKSGDRVRVAARLIRADSGYIVWSETYDRRLDDIFAIQDDIAHDVVKELRVTLLGEAPKVRTTLRRRSPKWMSSISRRIRSVTFIFDRLARMQCSSADVDYTVPPAGKAIHNKSISRRSVGENGGRLESPLFPRDED